MDSYYKLGKLYYKVDQFYYKVWQALIKGRATSRYCKVGQKLLKMEVGKLLQGETIDITKKGRQYKVGQVLLSRKMITK